MRRHKESEGRVVKAEKDGSDAIRDDQETIYFILGYQRPHGLTASVFIPFRLLSLTLASFPFLSW